MLALLAAVVVGQSSPPEQTAAPGAPPPPASTRTPQTAVPSATAQPATAAVISRSLPAAIPSGANVAVIRIEGMIYGFTLESMKYRVDRAVAGGASLIVFELNTPGGQLDSALDIAKYIKGQINLPTIAWINDKAYSAGILIASACDLIVMSPSSATGDCAPINLLRNLQPTERAKVLSPLLEEFRDNARSNNYDYAPFHAMCVLGVKVFMVENIHTGERRLVNEADFRVMTGKSDGEAGNLLSALIGAAPIPNAIAELEDVSVEIATPQDKGQWKVIKEVHDGKTLLTLNQTRALEIGLSVSDQIRSESDLQNLLGASSITAVPQRWTQSAAYWLTMPLVRGILMIVLLLSAYIEFQAPGVSVAGIIAIIAMVLLLGAPFLVGLAEVWHIVLFFIGFLLLMGEIFITPGFGVLGVSGIICMFIGLVLAVVPTSGGGMMPMPAPDMMGRLQASVFWMMMGVGFSLVAFFYMMRYFGSIPLFSALILRSEPATVPPGTATHVSGDAAIGGGRVKVGATGSLVGELHPVGRAEIDGQVIDVISQGEWIESGRKVRVVEVAGNRIVVEAVE